MLLYIIFSNKSKNKSCSVYYIGTFCFLLCLHNLDSLAAREDDLSEFAYKKCFLTLIQQHFLHQAALYNNMKKSCLMEDNKQLLLYI